MLRERKNETMTKLGEPIRRGGKCALRFRSYLRRERITCAKTTSYLEHSERKLGTTGKIRKSAGFRRHDAEPCRQARMAYNMFEAAGQKGYAIGQDPSPRRYKPP